MIQIKNISKIYRLNKQSKPIFALKNVSIELHKNQSYGVVGLNGSGKSTLIKTILGIIQPDEGEIIFEQKNPLKHRKYIAQNVAVMFGQRTQLLWDLPLIESFLSYKIIYKIDDLHFKNRFDDLVERLSLKEYLYQPVRTLSLGQRIKAELALAFLRDVQYVFLDEPTIGLDILVKKEVRKMIRTFCEIYCTTVIITSHDLDDIEGICHQLILLDKGSVIYNDNLKKFIDTYSKNNHIVLTSEHEITDSIINTIQEIHQVTNVSCNKNVLNIAYDKNILNPKELLEEVISKVSFTDIHISSDSLNDLIERVYRL